jgi:outer membrane protein assembly factor BamA
MPERDRASPPRAQLRASRAVAARWAVAAVVGLFAVEARGAPAQAAVAEQSARAAARPDDEGAKDPGVVARNLRIRNIEIVGTEQVSDEQVLKALESEALTVDAMILWPADPRVERARLRLQATGYFARVTLKLRPARGDDEGAVLIVDVDERASLTVTDLFLGSSAMTPFRGGLQLVERNFLGRAIHIGGGFIWGSQPQQLAKARRQQGVRLFAKAPRLPGTRMGLSGTFYASSASEPYRVAGALNDPHPSLFRTFEYTRVGGILGASFPITSRFGFGIDYRFEQVGATPPESPLYVSPEGWTSAIDLGLLPGSRRLTSTNFTVNWDGRDRAAHFGQGGRFALDLHLASPLVGSEYEYIRLVSGAAYTFRLPWRHWITPSILAGQIAGGAPRFERFYAGDLSELTPGRELGMIYSTRNPLDILGTGIDTRTIGNLIARGDVEYIWPLFRRSRLRGLEGGHLFFSAGIFTIAGDKQERQAWRALGRPAAPIGLNLNLGLRLETALGTLDISVGNVMRRSPI